MKKVGSLGSYHARRAFPQTEESDGMDMLEYYAGQAMLGQLSNSDHGHDMERIASRAVWAAQCLLKELHEG